MRFELSRNGLEDQRKMRVYIFVSPCLSSRKPPRAIFESNFIVQSFFLHHLSCSFASLACVLTLSLSSICSKKITSLVFGSMVQEAYARKALALYTVCVDIYWTSLSAVRERKRARERVGKCVKGWNGEMLCRYRNVDVCLHRVWQWRGLVDFHPIYLQSRYSSSLW